jgi:trimeric autotransporter adhesin
LITLLGSVTNNTDAATKAYVDAAISTGIVAKTPALVLGVTNVALNGLQTIDGVTLVANDRVLLINQTDPVENGLWLAQAGAWTRPADFDTGDTAGQAYVLILSGSINAGASYLCNTPTAIIGTDPIGFALFSLPNTTTGANVGTGTGLVFRNKTGTTLNFRSLLADTHMSIVSNTDDVTIGTDATSANTAGTIVARDGSGDFSAGTITASLTGAASLNVLKAGDTMTGSLTMPAGTVASPSLKFTGSATGTGITAETANVLSFDISGTEIMNVGATGVSIDAFTTAGVVHNSAAGLLTSSLIVNADVSPTAAIADTKLATISTAGKVANSATTATSANTPNTIVLRDGSGNFVAGTITANLTGSASNNVLKAGDTMTGTLQLPAGTAALPSLVFTGSTTTGLSASAGDLSFSTSGAEQLKIASGGAISINAFTTAGVVHNDATGNLTTSLIVNADVDPAAAIIDTKLATIVTPGKVANSATTATSDNVASSIVLRDSLGNFSAGAVSFTDAVIDNLTINGCIASACVTSLSIGEASLTGTLSVNDEVLNGTLTMTAFTPEGVLHNDASGVISSSLIVNADVDPAAAIVDTKLATIATAGKVSNSATTATAANTANTIVLRNGSGNFSAGTITASLTGAASLNVLKSGDTMTGGLTLPAGTAAVPSLQFTGSVNTGISAENLNTLLPIAVLLPEPLIVKLPALIPTNVLFVPKS